MKKLWILFGMVLSLGGAFYLYKTWEKPVLSDHHENVKPNLDVKEETSPKGLKVWLLEHHINKIISLSIIFRKAGGQSDPEGKKGRSFFATLLLNEGSGPDNAQAFQEKVLAQNLQYSIHAERDEVRFFARFPAENLKADSELIKAMLTDPRNEEEDMKRIRDRALVRMKQSLNVDSTVGEIAFDKLIYSDRHPYSRTVKDTIQDLPQITREDLIQFRKDRLAKDQLEVVAVGDFDPQDFLKTMDEIFKDLPEKAAPLDIPPVELQNMGQEKFVELDVPQTLILFLQPGIKRKDPDFIPASILNRIVGAGEWHARLWDDVREKSGLVYYITTELTLGDHDELIYGNAATKQKSAKEVISKIRQHWGRIQKDGVTQQELDYAKDNMIGSLVNSLDSTGRLCKSLAQFRYHGLEPDYINKRNDLISKVTLEEINRVAKSLYKPEQLTIVVVGREETKS